MIINFRYVVSNQQQFSVISTVLLVFDKGEEQDSEAEEENEENQFDEDVDLYNGILKKILPGRKINNVQLQHFNHKCLG